MITSTPTGRPESGLVGVLVIILGVRYLSAGLS